MRHCLPLALLFACAPASQDPTGDDDDPADTDASPPDDSVPVDTDPSPPDDTDAPDTDPADTGGVDADRDGFTARVDCNDADPHAFPGAPELCDGLEQDCVPGSRETASVFLPATGVRVNLSPWLDGAAPPGPWTTPGPGVIQLCPGDHIGAVIIAHDDVELRVQPGVAGARLDGATSRAVDVLPGLSGVALRDVDLTGVDVDGGAVRVGEGSVVALENVLLVGGLSSGRGGCLHVGPTAQVELRTAELSGCQASEGGGVWLGADAELRVDDTTFEANAATAAGGALGADVGATLLARNVSFLSNTSDGDGGGLHLRGPERVEITESDLNRNTAAGDGGGLWAVDLVSMILSDVAVQDNEAGASGGGLRTSGGTLQFTGTRFVTNHALADGGAMTVVDGNLSLVRGDVDANDARTGGGASVDGGFLLSLGTSWFDNFATQGGAIAALDATLNIDGGVNGGNRSSEGGAVYLERTTADVLNSTWTGDRARDGGFAWVGDGSLLRVTSAGLFECDADAGAAFWARGAVQADLVTVHRATSRSASVAQLEPGGSFTTSRTDLGAGADDNSTPEIVFTGGTFDADGASATLSCGHASGCAP